MSILNKFTKFASCCSEWAGSASFFIIVCAATIVWLLMGPYVNYSDTWQLVCNTTSTIITTLLIVLVQNSQNRDNKALHLKLDELIRAIQGADNKLMHIEKLSTTELDQLQQYQQYQSDEAQG